MLGVEARMWTSSPTEHTAIGPVEGSRYPEVRAWGMTTAAYVELLGHLDWTDEAGFEATLPERFVTTGEHASVVAEMTSDISFPPGFVMPTLTQKDPDLLAYSVAATAACAWLDRFGDATARGDQEAADDAAAGLAASRRWDVLEQTMVDETSSHPIWELADVVQAGRVPSGARGALGCSRWSD
jgi:hypothetical protein